MENQNFTSVRVSVKTLVKYTSFFESIVEFEFDIDRITWENINEYTPQEKIAQALQLMVDFNTRNDDFKYDYVSHKLVLNEPKKLTGNFTDFIRESLNDKF